MQERAQGLIDDVPAACLKTRALVRQVFVEKIKDFNDAVFADDVVIQSATLRCRTKCAPSHSWVSHTVVLILSLDRQEIKIRLNVGELRLKRGIAFGRFNFVAIDA